jgi:organic radical activating enzyme
MMKERFSYTAASVFPLKVIQSAKSIIDEDGKIRPYHVQLNPTNVCNLSCSFCSCKNRSRKDVLPLSTVIDMMNTYKELGCKAVTITGGGEPLLHPQINEIIYAIGNIGIDIGLVTNGTVLHKLRVFNGITWIRISSEDTRDFDSSLLHNIATKNPKIDWAFSHVLSTDPNIKQIGRLVQFANEHKFTHVRIVSDLLNLKDSSIDIVKRRLQEKGIDDSKVIYQGRKDWTKGTEKCYISLLKPVIGACKGLYPCCGAQYALETPSLDLTEEMRMGTIKDIKTIFNEQKYFDGSKCVRCYYSSYNEILGLLIQRLKHEVFV